MVSCIATSSVTNLGRLTPRRRRVIPADLSAFAGQTGTLKFTATEDASLQTSFVVDDAAVTLS